MILTNELNTRILIQRKSITEDNIGADEDSWDDYRYLNASKLWKSGNPRYDENGLLIATTTDFKIRYDASVNYDCRIKYNNDYYKILYIEPLGRKNGMRINTIMFEDNE